MLFSVIIPVFNRPKELMALLDSLSGQCYRDFEVIVVDDGSDITCEAEVLSLQDSMNLTYVYQQNSGQGFARNKGMHQANGNFFIFLDSDCILPTDYLSKVAEAVNVKGLDAFGGPDRARDDFNPLQQAMNYSMTSFWTTGGIRGKMKDPAKYQARGYNMGFSREVFEEVGGFRDANRAEDIEISLRIKKAGFRLELVQEAWVYHHRKSTLWGFAKQSHQFGRNRIHVNRLHPGAMQLVHLLPLFFLIGMLMLPVLYGFFPGLFAVGATLFGCWVLAILVSASFETGSLRVGLLAVLTSCIQLACYGAGIAYGPFQSK
ncbi:MAG: glycosyltransferase [Lunatimonas sp.]|uniref:glycosyltransferase n=1 Tax=Lunatimonas sp. TaxID=2060141 RepID=UPI00263B6349|nr:glycosyltransferase [Lunatimonas sp.]MCC5937060.1 glycosyltransferase [Lunatimonas sp.]